MTWSPGRVWGEPADCPDGIRHVDGASLVRALARNAGTCRPDTVAGSLCWSREGVLSAGNAVRCRVPSRGTGADRLVVVTKPSNAGGAKETNRPGLLGQPVLAFNPFSILVMELPSTYLRLVRNQTQVGYCVAIYKRHVAELHQLDVDGLAGFWTDVADASHAICELFAQVKLDHLSMGHLCPHLHCHIYPQYQHNDPRQNVDISAGNDVIAEPTNVVVVALLGLAPALAGTAVAIPTLLTLVTAAAEESRRGRPTATVSTAAHLGFLVGPLFGGTLADQPSLRWAFVRVAAVALVFILGTPTLATRAAEPAKRPIRPLMSTVKI